MTFQLFIYCERILNNEIIHSISFQFLGTYILHYIFRYRHFKMERKLNIRYMLHTNVVRHVLNWPQFLQFAYRFSICVVWWVWCRLMCMMTVFLFYVICRFFSMENGPLHFAFIHSIGECVFVLNSVSLFETAFLIIINLLFLLKLYNWFLFRTFALTFGVIC